MDSKTIKVTIYRNGGIVTKESKIHLKKGINNIKLEGLSKTAQDETLKINTESLKYSNLQIKTLKENELINKISEELQEIESLKNKIKVKEQQKALWNSNADFTQKEKADYDQIKKYINNYSNNILSLDEEILNLKIELTNKQASYSKLVDKTNRKIITFDIESNEEKDEIIQFSFLEPNTSWNPVFELYANDNSTELKVLIKGKIIQSTEEIWDNVKLNLYTGNPTLSQSIPIINTEYVRFIDTSNPQTTFSKTRGAGIKMKDVVFEESRQILSKASISNEISYDSVSRTDEETTTQYDLSGVWTVSNSSNGLLVDLYDFAIPTEISHLLIPKYNFNGYLVAKVDSNKLADLESQEVTIYYNDNYTGKAFINIDRENDETLLSLGIDEKLTGTRHKENFHTNTLTKQKDSVKIKLNIASSNKNTIPVIITDTLPKSTDKNVTIENIELDNGKIDDNNIIKWEFDIEANSKKEIEFSYDILYPKKGIIK